MLTVIHILRPRRFARCEWRIAFDLVITDMAMPEMTGTNLAKALLDIRPDLPVILSTGYSDQINEEMLERLGIKALLMKPITIQELSHAIRMALKR